MPKQEEEPLLPRERKPPPEYEHYFSRPLKAGTADERDSDDVSYTPTDEEESDASGMDEDEPGNTPGVPGGAEGADDIDMLVNDPGNPEGVPGGGAGADGGQNADLAEVAAVAVTEMFYNAEEMAETVDLLDVEWDESFSVLLTLLETLVGGVLEFEDQQYLLVYKVIDVYKANNVPFSDQLSFDTSLDEADPFVKKWMDIDQAMYIKQAKVIHMVPDVNHFLAQFTNSLNSVVENIVVSIEREGDVAAPDLEDLLVKTASLDEKKRAFVHQCRKAHDALRDPNLRRRYEHAREGGFKAAYEHYVRVMQAREAKAAGKVVSDARYLTITERGNVQKPGGLIAEGTGETPRHEVDDGEEEYTVDRNSHEEKDVLEAWSIVARTQTRFYSFNDEQKFRLWARDSSEDVQKTMVQLGYALPREGQHLDLSIETLAEIWFAFMFGNETEWDSAADEATALDARDVDRTAYILIQTKDRNTREERANKNSRQEEPTNKNSRQYDAYREGVKKRQKTQGSGSKGKEEEEGEDESPDEEERRPGIRIFPLDAADGGRGGGGGGSDGGASASGGGGGGGKAISGGSAAGGSSADRASASGSSPGRASGGGASSASATARVFRPPRPDFPEVRSVTAPVVRPPRLELPEVGSVPSENAEDPDFLPTYRLPEVKNDGDYRLPESSRVKLQADRTKRKPTYEPEARANGEVWLPSQNRVENLNMIVRDDYYPNFIAETRAELVKLGERFEAKTSGFSEQQNLQWNINQLKISLHNALRANTVNNNKLSGETKEAEANTTTAKLARRYFELDLYRELDEQEAASIRDTQARVAADNGTVRDGGDEGLCTIREVERAAE